MANHKLVIQKNSGHPISDSPRTLFFVRLAWLLNKPVAFKDLADPFSFQGAIPMLSETPIPDQFSFETTASEQVFQDLPESIDIETEPPALILEDLT